MQSKLHLYIADSVAGLKFFEPRYNSTSNFASGIQLKSQPQEKLVVAYDSPAKAIYANAKLRDLSCISGFCGGTFTIIEAYPGAIDSLKGSCTLYEIKAEGFDVADTQTQTHLGEYISRKVVNVVTSEESTSNAFGNIWRGSTSRQLGTPIANSLDAISRYGAVIVASEVHYFQAGTSIPSDGLAVACPNFVRSSINPATAEAVSIYHNGNLLWTIGTLPCVYIDRGVAAIESVIPTAILIGQDISMFNCDLLPGSLAPEEPFQPLLVCSSLSLQIPQLSAPNGLTSTTETNRAHIAVVVRGVMKSITLHLVQRDCIIVATGHDYILAAAIAAAHPDRVRGLVFIEPQGGLSKLAVLEAATANATVKTGAYYSQPSDPILDKIPEHPYKKVYETYSLPDKMILPPLLLIQNTSKQLLKPHRTLFRAVTEAEPISSPFAPTIVQYPTKVAHAINAFVAQLGSK